MKNQPTATKGSAKAFHILKLSLAIIFLITPFFINSNVMASSPYTFYSDTLSPGWHNWSWGAGVNFDNGSPTNSGSKSISFSPSPWAGLYLHNDGGVNTSSYITLHFAVRPTSSSTKLAILTYDNNSQLIKNVPLNNYKIPAANSWTTYDLPLGDLGIANRQIKGIGFQEISGQGQPTTYFDDITLEPAAEPTPSPTPTPQPLPTTQPTPQPTTTVTNTSVYNDSLTSDWANWSWGSGVNLNSGNAYSGGKSIAFTPYSGWAGLYLHNNSGINTSGANVLHFTAKASSGGQGLQILLYDGNNNVIKAVNLNNYGGQPIADSWKVYNIPLADLNASSRQIKGVVFQESLGRSQPTLYIDEVQFTSNATTQPSPTPQPLTTPAPNTTPTPTVAPIAGGNWTTSGSNIYNNGQKVYLHGVNWFGFETANYAPHGLWSRNWKNMISQMKSLGFNSVRIPVNPDAIRGVTPSGIDYSQNPDLHGLNSIQVLDKMMAEFNNQGISVLLDHHRPDSNAISELWYTGSYSEGQWINDLVSLANRYKGHGNLLGIDLKNEPHGAATWGSGNSSTDWNIAAERAGRAVLSTNPNILVFVEGIEKNGYCSSSTNHWWGGNIEPQSCNPIQLPSNKLVLSPHVYGPDVFMQPYFTDGGFPGNMPAIWDAHFGNLKTRGLPIAIGEWGGRYGNGGNSMDYTWQNALVNYFKSKGICNTYYWSWNPNSGDTGGVLQDDWKTPWSNKVSMLQSYFNSCSN